MATNTAKVEDLWDKNHDILFLYNGIEYFAFKQLYEGKKIMQVLCDDGLKCRSRIIETESSLFDEELNGTPVREMIKKGEIKYIY